MQQTPGKKANQNFKAKFSEEEDLTLKALVQKYGAKNWPHIASLMPNRNERQCRDRWEFFLAPHINHSPFTEAEDRLLIQKRNEIGAHWVKISSFFQGRTDTMLKNRYNLLIRKYTVPQPLMIMPNVNQQIMTNPVIPFPIISPQQPLTKTETNTTEPASPFIFEADEFNSMFDFDFM